MNPFLISLLLIFFIQIIFFIFAAVLKTDNVTDLAYGLTFVLVANWWYWQLAEPSLLQTLVTTAISLWGVRLAGFLFVRVIKMKRDKRFDGIRENVLKFAGFWTLQTVSIWVILLPSLWLLTQDHSQQIDVLSWIGILMWGVGFVIQAVADQQKFIFKNKSENKDKLITSGIFKYSQYPNYFGEMLMWWSIFWAISPLIQGWVWLIVVGPIFITSLLLFVSGIPTVEKQRQDRFGKDKAYLTYKNRTSLLVPFPPKTD